MATGCSTWGLIHLSLVTSTTKDMDGNGAGDDDNEDFEMLPELFGDGAQM